ncbi:hypothetical protein ACWEKM_41450 [Streptomyces sp. NPDC004752]
MQEAVQPTLPGVRAGRRPKGRVDMEQDRMTRTSVRLIGAKLVGDLTRGVMFGIMAASFCSAAARLTSIAATSPSQPCSLASWSRSSRFTRISLAMRPHSANTGPSGVGWPSRPNIRSRS